MINSNAKMQNPGPINKKDSASELPRITSNFSRFCSGVSDVSSFFLISVEIGETGDPCGCLSKQVFYSRKKLAGIFRLGV